MRTRSPSRTISGVVRRTGLAVEQQPVEFHVHRVRHGVVGQHRILLQMNQEILVAVRAVGLLGMHDEAAQHSGHLLHRHVRVIEVSAFLVNVELIDKAAARLDRRLADPGHAVVPDVVFKSMPVHRGRFRQLIVEDHANMVPLIDLNRRPRRAAVEAPEIDASSSG